MTHNATLLSRRDAPARGVSPSAGASLRPGAWPSFASGCRRPGAWSRP
jgi:hypothetical protein